MAKYMHGNWFIHVEKGINKFIAWASKERMESVLSPSKSDVYFKLENTEREAIIKLIDEIGNLGD